MKFRAGEKEKVRVGWHARSIKSSPTSRDTQHPRECTHITLRRGKGLAPSHQGTGLAETAETVVSVVSKGCYDDRWRQQALTIGSFQIHAKHACSVCAHYILAVCAQANGYWTACSFAKGSIQRENFKAVRASTHSNHAKDVGAEAVGCLWSK